MSTENTVKTASNKGFHWRSTTSFTLAGVFLVMCLSGVILYFSPRGRTAHWTDWTMFSLTKDQWTSLHINISILFIGASIFHLFLNWKPFWSYIRKKTASGLHRKAELGVAVILTLLVTAGSAAIVQPFKAIMDVNEYIKDVWEEDGAGPPIPHGEELSVQAFAEQVGIDPAEFLAALEAEGYTVEDPAVTTIRETAASKGANVPPSRLFEDLKKHFPKLSQSGSGAGYGMMTVEEFAAEVGLDTADVVDFLQSEGCVIDDPAETELRDAAKSKGIMPPQLMELLKSHFPQIESGREEETAGTSTEPANDGSNGPVADGRNAGTNGGASQSGGGGGGFGMMTIQAFSSQTGVEATEVVDFLQSEGCEIEDPSKTTIRDAAQSLGLMPPQLMEKIRAEFPEIETP